MIAIRKGAAPSRLVRPGEENARELCLAYEADSEPYRSGERKMAVCERIYKAVKRELEACHHGKCCYCEMLFDDHKPYAYSYVEHWRPKSSSRQALGERRIWPGYYWLAYSWDNLLLSCAFCNLKKSDLFPLAYPAARARHHGMGVADETPGILKPDGDKDLCEHITFVNENPVGLTPLGRKTIEVLDLASPAHGPRLTHLDMIRKARERYIKLMDSVDPVDCQEAEYLRKTVDDAVRPEKPYSAMIAAYLRANPLPEAGAQAVKRASGAGSATTAD